MKLVQKGQEANIVSLKQLVATMKWTTAIDFDLAAVYEAKSGNKGMICFKNKGNMNVFPFMALDQDAGVGDTGGNNEENLRITKLDDMNKVHLICWDYKAVQRGIPARFANSDLSIVLTNDQGETQVVNLDAGDVGNVVVIATIDNTSPIGAKIINASKVGSLKNVNEVSTFALENT